jgi:hypothetical protein
VLGVFGLGVDGIESVLRGFIFMINK